MSCLQQNQQNGSFQTDLKLIALYKKWALLLLVSYCCCALGQGQLDEKTVILFRNERTGAGLLNSNGWGGNFRYFKRMDYFNRKIYDVDLVLLKDPKEFKFPADNGNTIVLLKLNTCITTRFGYGRQKEIFSKFDKDGISVKYFYSGGFSLTFAKPYYYEMEDGSIQSYDEFIAKYGVVNKLLFYPVGKAPFGKGLDKTKLYPGVHVKGGFDFEFGKSEEVINALEIGASLDLYPKKVPIMAVNDGSFYFLTLFIGYRFGKPVDNSSTPKKKKVDAEDEIYW